MPAQLRLFGGAAIIGPDGQLVSGAAAQPRRLAVLAILADAWPTPVTRDRIVGLIWPDQDEGAARRLLTQALYELRRELGDFTRVSGRDLSIDTDALRVDLIDFRRALAEGEVERAVELHRRPFLDGFYLRGASEFERWTDTLRDRTCRQLRRAIEDLTHRLELDGRLRDAVRLGEHLVETAPSDARAVLRLMDLCELAGDRGAALAAANAYEQRMRTELEVDPDPVVLRRVDAMRVRGFEPAVAPEMTVATEPVVMPVADAPAQVSAPVSRRRPVLRVAAWLGGLAASLAVLLVIPSAVFNHGTESATTRALDVFPLAVEGDAPASSPLGPIVTQILIANLDGSGGARLERVVGDGTAPLSDSRGRADDRQRRGSIRGAVVQTGDQLRFDVELRRAGAQSKPITFAVSGSRDSLPVLAERLSLQMLPSFYPELDAVLDAGMLARFRSARVLRKHLDGEAALRRGAYDEAYSAFRGATELDSSLAYTWYRRAIAAETAHRIEDADRSIRKAQSLQGSLSERERLLIAAYARWRAGDARGAEADLRRLLETQSRDREAWFQFAEVAYHAGPLLGRSPEAARDPWWEVVTLDSGNYPALLHATRLAARAADTARVTRLLEWGRQAGAAGPVAVESRAIAAYGLRDRRAIAAVQPELDTLPDYSLDFVQGMVAGFLEQPGEADAIARRLIARSRPDADRAEGRIALAHLAMARGRWRQAWTELDSAAKLNPVAASWTRAYFAILPFFTPPPPTVATVGAQLAGASAGSGASPLYLRLAVDAQAAPLIRQYLTGMLRLSESSIWTEAPAAVLDCAGVGSGSTKELCLDMSLGLVAEGARKRGDDVAALRALESLGMRVPYQLAARSVFFARTRERFLRAELLERAGRYADAYAWYAAAPHGDGFGYIYLAPSHLARGRIRERLGDRAGAAEHYARVLELWREPDIEMMSLVREAAGGLRRVTGSR